MITRTNITNSKVYVLQESMGKNLLPATAFGRVIVCLPPTLQITFESDTVINSLIDKLSNFNKDTDYLLLMGDPAIIAIASIIIAKITDYEFTILKWDRQEHSYIAIKVEL